jgi:hypothetical protein
MSTDQELPESQVNTENETVVEPSHTELVEHELTIEDKKLWITGTRRFVHRQKWRI